MSETGITPEARIRDRARSVRQRAELTRDTLEQLARDCDLDPALTDALSLSRRCVEAITLFLERGLDNERQKT